MRDGVRLVCRDWGGTGPSVLLLHGLAGHAGEWDAVARRLSPRFRVVALDQRGHGASERLPEDVSRAAYVADVVAVAGELGLGAPVVVGQSLGGHTAFLTAAAHPEAVRAVVLVDAGAGGPSPAVPEEIGRWLDSWPVPFASRDAAVRFFGGGAVGEGWADGLREGDGGWWPRFDRGVMVRSLAECAERSFLGEWRTVVCPTLVVLARSSLVAPGEFEAMLRLRPSVTSVSVPDTGHDVHLQRPAVVAELVADFMDGLAP
ncbi:alpha/beta fold hydrolase [Streptomyces sp. enrichment culture]|uniref:alpha/beta fold hydrolase n=1 Tax=Streptomyces sp. enrichment culture TaxID=1795815 RepID=UPI003F57787C